MTTTLNISAEAMARVRQLALRRGGTLGEIASELILTARQPEEAPPVRNGVPLFPSRDSEAADLGLVNTLRDTDFGNAPQWFDDLRHSM